VSEYTIPTTLTGDHPVNVTYVPKTYTVTLDGAEFATFQYGGEYGINLEPYSTDAASNVYYQYTIGSDVRKVDNGETKGYYKFASLDVFDENNSFPISRKKIDKTVEEIDAFISSLNAGLDETDVKDVLDSDLYNIDVENDEDTALSVGIHAVPFYLFDNKYSVPGALSYDDFKKVLSQIAAENEVGQDKDASSCSDGVCKI
jgi:hypothetical protein